MAKDDMPTDTAPVAAGAKSADTTLKYKGRELLQTTTGVTRDILTTLLDPAAEYSEAEVKQKLEKYLKKEAKQ